MVFERKAAAKAAKVAVRAATDPASLNAFVETLDS